MEAEDSDSEDAVLSSEEEEDSAEVLLVFPPYDGFGGGAACKRREREQTGECQCAEFSEFHLVLPLCNSIKIEKILADFVAAMHSI